MLLLFLSLVHVEFGVGVRCAAGAFVVGLG